MREAPSINLMNNLIKEGCDVTVYDPVAMPECKRIMENQVGYATNMYDTLTDAHALFHVTEWNEFRMPSLDSIKQKKKSFPLLIDGRNVYSSEQLAGITYMRIG